MKPILIFLLGAGALWALQRGKQQLDGQGIVLPQNQRGISRFRATPTPQQPQQLYASQALPPGTSYDTAGYVPAFGPYFSSVDPNSLYWNQA